MTNGSGFIRKRTLSELRPLKLKHGALVTEQPIPTLAEVAARIPASMLLNVEIKSNGSRLTGIEQKVLETLNQSELMTRSVISSFNPIVLRRIRKLSAEATTGLLINKNITVPTAELMLMKLTGANGLHISGKLAREQLINKVRRFGFFSFIWTVNEPRAMERLIQLGVNGIITDRPDVMMQQISKES
jgi:glycerophosphoryl diester phosphodiesterase